MSPGNKYDALDILPRLLIIYSEADVETPIPPGGWMKPLFPMLPAAVTFFPEAATWLLVTFLENGVAAFRAEGCTTRPGKHEPEPHLYQAGVGDEQVAPMGRGRRQEARGTDEGHAEGVLWACRWASICRLVSRVLWPPVL